MRLEVSEPVRVPLTRPLETSYGCVRERELIAVTLTARDGQAGYGEAAPLESYDGLTTARVQAALASHAQALADAPVASGAGALDACRAADPLPQALAAVDMALWDLAGRRAGRPVAQLLCEHPARAVRLNATIFALDRAGAAQEAASAAAAGFGCVKVKVGTGDDAGRVAAVRAAAGADMQLRLDANGAWGPEQAVRELEALAPVGLELVEEPVHGIEAVRSVRERVPVRIAIDETAALPGALSARVADAVCLKISRCGGISGLLAAATLARTSGAEVYVASTLDGPLGIAAALHAAAALASSGPLAPCGLATLGELGGLAAAQALVPRDGVLHLPDGPGLGVEGL